MLIAAVLLAGCVPTDNGVVTPEAGETSTPTPTQTESAAPTEAPVDDSWQSVTIACDQLVSSQAMYDFDPNYSLKPSFTPAAGSLAAEAVDNGGIACQWVHQTSGQTIDLSVAQPPADVANALANDLVGSSNSVPTYGVEGYFRVEGTTGEAQAFPSVYWITAVSPAFFEPGDAAPVVTSMVAALG